MLYGVYTYILCVRGRYGVLGLRQINTYRKVPLQANFFYMMTFCIVFYESYLTTEVQYLLLKGMGLCECTVYKSRIFYAYYYSLCKKHVFMCFTQ
jgi:hypothetical protein